MPTTACPSRSRNKTVRAAIMPVAPATAIRTVGLASHALGRLASDSDRLPDGRMFINGVYLLDYRLSRH